MPWRTPTPQTWKEAGRVMASVLEHALASHNHVTLCTPTLRGPMCDCLTDANGQALSLSSLLGDILNNQRGVRIILWSPPSHELLPQEIKPVFDAHPRRHSSPHPGEMAIFCNTDPSLEHPITPFICSHPPREPGHYMLFFQQPIPIGVLPSANGLCPPFRQYIGSQAQPLATYLFQEMGPLFDTSEGVEI